MTQEVVLLGESQGLEMWCTEDEEVDKKKYVYRKRFGTTSLFVR